MGILDWLTGSSPGGIVASGAAGTIQGLASGIGSLARDIRTAITGKLDPEKQAEIDQKIAELENAAMQGQIDINKIEAASTNWFVAGARPFIMWICGFALAYQFIGFSLLQWAGNIFHFQSPPALDTNGLITILVSLLGLGTLRTKEKIEGVQNSH
jgi:Holin of 3TMs, for gene-transfer release